MTRLSRARHTPGSSALCAATDVPVDDPDLEQKTPARALVERLLEPARAAPQSLGAQLRWIRAQLGGVARRGRPRQHRRTDAGASTRSSARCSSATAVRLPTGRLPTAPRVGVGPDRPTSPRRSARIGTGWPSSCSSRSRRTCGWRSSPASTAAGSGAWTRSPTRSSTSSVRAASRVSGSSASGSGATPRARSSSAAATPMRWPPPTRSPTTGSRTSSAARPPGATCATALRHAALRLAADMVPNHMGLDSSWVVEHPERFISSPYPPFEAYTYDGPGPVAATGASSSRSRTTTGIRPTPR